MAMNLGTDGLVIFQEQDGHRMTYHPGADLSAAPQEVVDASTILWTEEAVAAWRASMDTPEPEPPTDWDGFNLAILSNAEFNQVYGAVMQTHPLIAAALPAALTQVSTGQTSMFATAFTQLCAVAEVSPGQREAWAALAASYNCPDEFVAVIRGIGNG